MYKMFCDICHKEMPDERATRAYVSRNYTSKHQPARVVYCRLEVRAANDSPSSGHEFNVDVCASCLVDLANDVKNVAKP